MSSQGRWLEFLTVANYALISVLWAVILVLYLRYRRVARAEDSLVAVLAGVLALDAFKSLVENVYFGVLFAGQFGILFESATGLLSSPGALIGPKLLNLLVAIVILTIVMRRWIPQEMVQRRRQRAAEETLRGKLVASLEDVRAKEERWQLALAASQDGIWDRDVETGRIWVSPRLEEQLGHPPGTLTPTADNWVELVHPEDRTEQRTQIEAVFAGCGAPSGVEVRMRARDGRYRRVLARSSARRDEAGRVTRVVGSMVDVTDQRDAEAALAARQRTESLGMLAGGVAHDFNNLLAVIGGNVQLLGKRSNLSGEDARSFEDLECAVARATALTSRLLAYSGRGRVVEGPLDLSSFGREMTRLLGSSAPATIRIETSFVPELPTIDADAAQIQQVFMNLFTNAVEASGKAPGVVSLRTRLEDVSEPIAPVVAGEPTLAPGTYVVLEVQDTGVGMDERVRQRVFDPFFSSKANGRGLGMSALLGIVRAHHAAVRLTSAPGEGTTFTLFFPPSAHQTPPPLAVKPSEAPARGARRRALVVDDEEMLRRLLKRLLESAQFGVDVAEDGDQALEKLGAAAANYDLVVLDLTLPGKDGREVLAWIRARSATLPVLVASGYAEEAIQLDGATQFLRKPFSLDQLRGAVETLVGGG